MSQTGHSDMEAWFMLEKDTPASRPSLLTIIIFLTVLGVLLGLVVCMWDQRSRGRWFKTLLQHCELCELQAGTDLLLYQRPVIPILLFYVAHFRK